VARARISDSRVWRRARDYLGLMDDPALCLSVLRPSRPSHGHPQNPGTVNWNDGGTKMIAHIPFYILGEQEATWPVTGPSSACHCRPPYTVAGISKVGLVNGLYWVNGSDGYAGVEL
ncbi:hypothetical protein J1N35_004231, partial [Gossypium stocksii]